MRKGNFYYGCLFLAWAVFAAPACSTKPQKAEVFGTVLVDGKAPEKGYIGFIPLDGKTGTTGGEILAGKYSTQVFLGEQKVEIRIPKKVGKKKLYDAPGSDYQDVFEEVLPPEFNDETKLRFEVNAGKNEKNWDLKSKP